jgi:hypothetical protein
MADAVNREHVISFLGGFLVGKIMSALVSMLLIWGFFIEDPLLTDIVFEEFVY